MKLILSKDCKQAWVAEANINIFLGEYKLISHKKDIDEIEITCKFGNIKTKNFEFLEKENNLPFLLDGHKKL